MSRRMVVTGRQGQVARSLIEIGPASGFDMITAARPELDLAAPQTVEAAISDAVPDIIVSAAAYTAVDQAEREPDLARTVNTTGAGAVAAVANSLGIPIIHLSTDYVFDGQKATPYVENDEVAPINVYGATKLASEEAVAAASGNHCILRTSWVYAPYGNNFVRTMLSLAGRDELKVVADQQGCPSYAPEIARAIIAIARNLLDQPDESGLRGIFHLAGEGETTWADFSEAIFALLHERGLPIPMVNRVTSSEYPTAARRPMNSRLNCTRLAKMHGIQLPPWRSSLRVCIDRLFNASKQL
jgi:dTDP-4-dehydrorhamnose reductase